MKKENIFISVIGMGYVGLPLANELSKYFNVTGYDTNIKKIKNLKRSIDSNKELKKINKRLFFTSKINHIKKCNVYIVTVPTPIDKGNKPDLIPLVEASKTISKFLSKRDIVVYESTVYPGATEEICVPELELSGLRYKQDFFY